MSREIVERTALFREVNNFNTSQVSFICTWNLHKKIQQFRFTCRNSHTLTICSFALHFTCRTCARGDTCNSNTYNLVWCADWIFAGQSRARCKIPSSYVWSDMTLKFEVCRRLPLSRNCFVTDLWIKSISWIVILARNIVIVLKKM